MRRIAECHPSQVQIASSTGIIPTTGHHERSGNAFHGSVLFDLSSEFLWFSDLQSSIPSNVRVPLETKPNKIRDMVHTPAGGIDEEIQLTRPPHSRGSAITPIPVLPPELLAQIFRFYALEGPPSSGGVQELGWIGVTHVCRCWRQVALGDLSLWARITRFSSNMKWISEMLVRARNAPLVVDFVVTPAPEVLSMFPPHIFRIRELRLRGLDVYRSQGLLQIFALEAPALEHLELVSTLYPVSFHQLCGTTLFGGQVPKLRTLSLSGVPIPWSLVPRGQLTQLKISLFIEIPFPNTPSSNESSQLLDLLINTPDLEVLVLEFCLPTMLVQALDGQAIHLPRLSRLCLAGSTSRIASLLKMLQLPSSTALHLRCVSKDPSNVNIILPLVSAHFHNPTPVWFRSLSITINDLGGPIYVAASIAHLESTISGLQDDTDGDAELTMSFDAPPLFGHSTSTQEDILEDVFSMLPISNIELFSISVPDFVPSVNWYELSQRCEKVTTIRVGGGGTSGLLRSLAPLRPTKSTSGSKGKEGKCVNGASRAQGAINPSGGHAAITPFPKLTSLLLENLDLSFPMAQYGVLYHVIAYVLRWRRANNTPLNVLGVDHCVITPDRAKSLKKYVQELRWDGDEGLPFKGWDGDEGLSRESFEEWDSDEGISIGEGPGDVEEWDGDDGIPIDE